MSEAQSKNRPPGGRNVASALAAACLAEIAFDVAFNLARGSAFYADYVVVYSLLMIALAVLVSILGLAFSRSPVRLALSFWAAAHGFFDARDPVSAVLAASGLGFATWWLLPRQGPSGLGSRSLGAVVAVSICMVYAVGPYAAGAIRLPRLVLGGVPLFDVFAYTSALGLWQVYARVQPRYRLAASAGFLASTLLLGTVGTTAVMVQSTRPTIAALPSEAGALGAHAPHVVVLVLDTVRADHLSVYGYGRDTTPRLARLLEDYPNTRLYDLAFSTSNWTVPSHASLLTGEMPSVHGAHSATGGSILYSAVASPQLEAETTLAELLRESGYRTGAVLANAFVLRVDGMSRGFDLFVMPRALRPLVLAGEGIRRRFGWFASDLKPYPAARSVNQQVVRFLEGCDDTPCFVLANYMEAHSPFLAERPYAGSFAQSESLEPMGDPSLSDSASDVALKRDRYDEEIRGLDAKLGELFDALDARDMMDGIWLFITADHGESFVEHDSSGHGSSIYNEQTQIPLIVRPPGGESLADFDGPVSLLDIASTVAAIAGRDDFGAGRDLREPPDPDRSVRIEFYGRLRKKVEKYGATSLEPSQAVVRQHLKLIANDSGYELYDLERDPRESRDLAPGAPITVDKLRRELVLLELPEDDGEPSLRGGALPDEEALRQLGYIE